MRLVVYDCEIVNAIPRKNETPLEGITYAQSWRDFEQMGISVITAYDVDRGESRIFLEDNFSAFATLAHDPEVLLCGFNNRQFDDHLVATVGIYIPPKRSWDLLREIWISQELNPDVFTYSTHGGYGLEAVARHNLGEGKSGNGAFAPVLWQRGKRGEVIDYCMRDTMLTFRIAQRAIQGTLLNPKTNLPLNIGGFPTEWRKVDG